MGVGAGTRGRLLDGSPCDAAVDVLSSTVREELWHRCEEEHADGQNAQVVDRHATVDGRLRVDLHAHGDSRQRGEHAPTDQRGVGTDDAAPDDHGERREHELHPDECGDGRRNRKPQCTETM